jgi:hypothetical protein
VGRPTFLLPAFHDEICEDRCGCFAVRFGCGAEQIFERPEGFVIDRDLGVVGISIV